MPTEPPYAQLPRLPMPTRCPATGAPMEVSELHCPTSGVTVRGRFQPNEFALLTDEHLDFMRLFVKTRGNLKEIERILELSYPTVRNRFESLLRALGYVADEQEELRTAREDVLDKLERGEIDADAAAQAFAELKDR